MNLNRNLRGLLRLNPSDYEQLTHNELFRLYHCFVNMSVDRLDRFKYGEHKTAVTSELKSRHPEYLEGLLDSAERLKNYLIKKDCFKGALRLEITLFDFRKDVI